MALKLLIDYLIVGLAFGGIAWIIPEPGESYKVRSLVSFIVMVGWPLACVLVIGVALRWFTLSLTEDNSK